MYTVSYISKLVERWQHNHTQIAAIKGEYTPFEAGILLGLEILMLIGVRILMGSSNSVGETIVTTDGEIESGD